MRKPMKCLKSYPRRGFTFILQKNWPFRQLPLQTFRNRLLEVIDQAQHFAALGPTGGGGPTGDAAQAFREGLDGTERECKSLIALNI